METKDFLPSHEISIDSDVSREKAEFLINLGIEEERVDFKENLDFSSKARKKKSKIDLVCDIVAMTNTYGGYIIFGIKENDRGIKMVGVNQACIAQITQANIMASLSNFTNANIKILANIHALGNKNIIIVFVGKSRVMVPFSQHGQYEVNGKICNKFSSGEIYVRHGSRSEKANYEDIRRMTEEIRHDERHQNGASMKGFNLIASRLDSILTLFGQQQDFPSTNWNQVDYSIFEGSSEEIEDKFFRTLVSSANPGLIKRLISRQFKDVKRLLKNLEIEQDEISRAESSQRAMSTILEKSVPIWNAANQHGDINVCGEIANRLYDLYITSFSWAGTFQESERLKLQGDIISTVYILGAISIKENQPKALKHLIERKGHPTDHLNDDLWFRYMTTKLFRAKLIKSGLIAYTMTHQSWNEYLIEIFDNEQLLEIIMAQFDFVQCLTGYILSPQDDTAVWPAFMLFDKRVIQPIVEDIINAESLSDWLPINDPKVFVRQLERLDNYELRGASIRRYQWNSGGWNSLISDYLKAHYE